MTTPNNTVAGLAENTHKHVEVLDEILDGIPNDELHSYQRRAMCAAIDALASPAPSAGVGVEASDLVRELRALVPHLCARDRIVLEDAARRIESFAAPACPECSAPLLYECPACSASSYPAAPSAPPSVAVSYDRELIACMLETAAGVIETWAERAMLEQARLLREADNAEAANVSTVSAPPSVAGDAGELPGYVMNALNAIEPHHAATLRDFIASRLATAEQSGSAVQGEAVYQIDRGDGYEEIGKREFEEYQQFNVEHSDYYDIRVLYTTPPPAPAAEQGAIVADVAKEAGVKVGEVLTFLHRALAMDATVSQRISHDIAGCVVEHFRAQPEAREGMVLVPVVPTQKMLDAGVDAGVKASPDPWCPKTWAAMLAAAPSGVRVDERINLWFFRDLAEQQRLALFAVFGMPVNELTTYEAQRIALTAALSGKVGG